VIETESTKLLVEMVASQKGIFSLQLFRLQQREQTSFSMMKEKWKDFFLGLYKIKKRTKRIGKIWSISKSRPLKILLSQALYFLWFVLNRLYMRQSVVTISLCCVCAIIGVKCYSFYCLRCWNEELWWERQTYQRGCRAMLWN